MSTENVKLVVFAPLSHADTIRKTLGEAGAGKIGKYNFCSFSTRGTGRFHGNARAKPMLGSAEKYEAIEEERIEVIVPRNILKEVIEKVKTAHPYEEVVFDIYPLENL